MLSPRQPPPAAAARVARPGPGRPQPWPGWPTTSSWWAMTTRRQVGVAAAGPLRRPGLFPPPLVLPGPGPGPRPPPAGPREEETGGERGARGRRRRPQPQPPPAGGTAGPATASAHLDGPGPGDPPRSRRPPPRGQRERPRPEGPPQGAAVPAAGPLRPVGRGRGALGGRQPLQERLFSLYFVCSEGKRCCLLTFCG